MKFFLSTLLFCVTAITAVAQFAPPAGQMGSTALHKDSSIFVAWASSGTVQRGLKDISNPSLGTVNYGSGTAITGKADAVGVASLGDGGSAIARFLTPIVNGPGWDFAVFENAFVDTFLELAYVEVSSDGVNFYRFPAVSNTQDSIQVGSFGGLDATKINNLAGKYTVNHGTPFDLEELKDITGLDVNNVTHVKVIDIVGCIMDSFARYDKNNHKINDPWRTDFTTGGFDLDAIGVINTWPTGIYSVTKDDKQQLTIYPNPITNGLLNLQFTADKKSKGSIEVFDLLGRRVHREDFQSVKGNNTTSISLSSIAKGPYLIKVQVGGTQFIKKIITQ